MMSILERHLLLLLGALHRDPSAGNALAVRKNVVVLKDVADALDVRSSQQCAVRKLYDYLDAASGDAVDGRAADSRSTRLDIENTLSSMVAVSRRDSSVLVLSCVRDDLGPLSSRIDDLKPEDREPLQCLLSYVEATNRQALELAVRGDSGYSHTPGRFGTDRQQAHKRSA